MSYKRLRFLLATIVSLGLLVGLGSTAVAQDNAETLKVDPVHSNVMFRVKHFNTGYVFGQFVGETGTIKFDPENVENSSIELTMPVDSITTHHEKRDKHLKSPDFFDAKQFPKVTFKSKKVEKRTDDSFLVTGDLTMHGQTNEVTGIVQQVGSGKDPQGNFRRGFYTTLNIKRSDFGIEYMMGGVSDNVKLIIALEGVRQ